MKNKQTVWIARIAIMAALYVVLTLISYPFSYGLINFRISEVLMLLCFYNKKYIPSVTIGCLLSNIISTVDPFDMLFGTLATLIAAVIMSFIKNRIISSIIPVVVNALIVGVELWDFLKEPLLLCIGSVALGEIVVVMILGNVLFYFLEKNNHFNELVGINNNQITSEK